MGGVRYPKYNQLTKEIWDWAEKRNIFLSATYIASKDNVVADKLSRDKNVDTEWCLADYAYSRIVNTLGLPDIDLFASESNAKCEKFVSWYPSKRSFQVDAFTLN